MIWEAVERGGARGVGAVDGVCGALCLSLLSVSVSPLSRAHDSLISLFIYLAVHVYFLGGI